MGAVVMGSVQVIMIVYIGSGFPAVGKQSDCIHESGRSL